MNGKKVAGALVGALVSLGAFGLSRAAPTIQVEKTGADKITVSVAVEGSKAYARILSRNLELSGCFRVVRGDGAVKVTGTAGGVVSATGRGKSVSASEACADDASARMAARRFSDAMVKAFAGAKGFATTRIAFVKRVGRANGELYSCHPDGFDICQLTNDGTPAIGPRWAPNGRDIYYTAFLDNMQQVWCHNTETRRRQMLGSFRDGSTGCAVAPDGSRCAIVLSYQGNPELYVMGLSGRSKAMRMTKTPAAAEASPCWSPDGSQIAYVSDETRNPQVYVCDVATRACSRLKVAGKQNTHPDWSADGKLAWASLSGGQWRIMVADSVAGAARARAVTEPGSWQDPSWAADGRHLVASRDNALFLVDTAPDGDKPVQLFRNAGQWMNPAFSR